MPLLRLKNIFRGFILLCLGYALPALAATGDNVGIHNPIKANTLNQLLQAILEIVIQIGLPIIVIAIIFVGFKFITAQGKPAEIEKARQALFWVVIGAAIIIGAQVIVSIVTNTVKSL